MTDPVAEIFVSVSRADRLVQIQAVPDQTANSSVAQVSVPRVSVMTVTVPFSDV